MPILKVTTRKWDIVTNKPVISAKADHRLSIDIDARGVLWARIARGNDEEVPIEVEFAK